MPAAARMRSQYHSPDFRTFAVNVLSPPVSLSRIPPHLLSVANKVAVVPGYVAVPGACPQDDVVAHAALRRGQAVRIPGAAAHAPCAQVVDGLVPLQPPRLGRVEAALAIATAPARPH